MVDYLSILKQFWHYDSFRSIQQDIIESIGAGRDTLGLMPTGGGKSLTFQVPAMAKEGVCVVVTPLVALMKDQVAGLRRRGILAHCVNSAMTRDQMLAAYDNCIFGACKFLYISPERLKSELFVSKVMQMNVSMIVVDEAHCISQWGYDFRPSYLHIAEIRDILPGVPVLALTATATPRVADDIMEQLRFASHNIFKMSFERKNIAYVVRECENKEQQMLDILRRVPGSAIVYVRSRKRTKEYAQLLQGAGISADFFHAGLPTDEKDRRQEDWTLGRLRVIVCTNAFGMGIDKPDVRLVVHIDPPDSLEAYFQEAGRAGRDGNKSYAVFLWSDKVDPRRMRANVTNSFPPKEFIVELYNSICNYKSVGLDTGEGYVTEFDLERYCFDSHRQILQVYNALTLLGRAGFLLYEPNVEFSSRLMFTISRERLSTFLQTNKRLAPVVQSVLRIYTGLFTEYAHIDELRIGKMCGGLGRQAVYEALRELHSLGVVSYNPQRKASYLTWLTDRVHEKYMVIPASVYDDRLNDARTRVESVIRYCSSRDVCRSRMLLEYFGDSSAADCGHCDVCLDRKRTLSMAADQYDDIKQNVTARLANGPVEYSDLCLVEGHSAESVARVLRDLIAEGIVQADDSDVYSLTR